MTIISFQGVGAVPRGETRKEAKTQRMKMQRNKTLIIELIKSHRDFCNFAGNCESVQVLRLIFTQSGRLRLELRRLLFGWNKRGEWEGSFV